MGDGRAGVADAVACVTSFLLGRLDRRPITLQGLDMFAWLLTESDLERTGRGRDGLRPDGVEQVILLGHRAGDLAAERFVAVDGSGSTACDLAIRSSRE